MARQIVIGNGKMQANFDEGLAMRDLYYPGVGHNNHIMAHKNRLGIWVDGNFSWLTESDWHISLQYRKNSLVTAIKVHNSSLEISMDISDVIHFRDDIYIKKISVQNLAHRSREIRLFLTHDFSLNGNSVADTAFFEPMRKCICHYKGKTCLLMNGDMQGEGIYQFSIGKKRIRGAEGTWRDAEDGVLAQNPIDHGSIDSAISFRTSLGGNEKGVLYYWIAAGQDFSEVWSYNDSIIQRGPETFIEETEAYWNSWVKRKEKEFADLPQNAKDMYYRSLLTVRSQMDNDGAILASTDSELLLHFPDHYNYVWPRDGALVAYALDQAGYPELALKFFDFSARTVSEGGFFYHKYNPDGTPGSSWHPWWKNGTIELPIQEDETALVLFALGRHYRKYGDIELIQPMYEKLIVKSADFLEAYRDPNTNLPVPSYDLWEERRGIFSFTTAACVGALREAAILAKALGDSGKANRYENSAKEMAAAMEQYLYCPEAGRFLRGVYPEEDGSFTKDLTLDSSLIGLLEFGAFSPDDKRIQATLEAVRTGLTVKTEIGGMARYVNDYYAKKSEDIQNVPGNPWFICTLWMAEWLIEKAQTIEELHEAKYYIEWAVRYSCPSGLMAEQVHPYTGEPLSVLPLTWSHSTFVLAVEKYLEKYICLSNK